MSLIIGRGYISSALEVWLNATVLSSAELLHQPVGFLNKYHTVIYMSGANGTRAVNTSTTMFQWVAESMQPWQKLVYASSASVYGLYGAYGDTPNKESDPLPLIPKHHYDTIKRQMETIARTSAANTYGLRLGTVAGAAPHMRWELLVNKMVSDADKYGEIEYTDARRSVLGINDLCRAMQKIIQCDLRYQERHQLFNMASFHCTIKELAMRVADATSNSIKVKRTSKQALYQFTLDTHRFETIFSFRFRDTLDNIVSSLQTRLKTSPM
jgi:nucleoside-diphosphate-sugar epimerase